MITVSALTLSRSLCDDVVVLRLDGEADGFEVDLLHRALCEALLCADRAVVVDVARLTFIDTAATRVLIQAHSAAEERGLLALELAQPSTRLCRFLSWTDGDRVLPVAASVRQAVARVRTAPPRRIPLSSA